MKAALKDAGMQPEEIDYVNVHGTSTPLGDIAELKAVAGVFGDHVYDLNISSDQIDDGSPAGCHRRHRGTGLHPRAHPGVVPPTINVEELDPEIDAKLNLTLGKAQHRDVKAAMSNTFGFGGHNSTIIFRKF